MCWSSQPHTRLMWTHFTAHSHAHSHVNVPILIDSVTSLRAPLGVRLRGSSSAVSTCMTSYHSMVRCSLGCLAGVQYPGDRSVTQSGKCTRCMEGYQLDGTIRPCHQSRTPRDWYWCSLVGGRSTGYYPLLTMALTTWRGWKMKITSLQCYEALECLIAHADQIMLPVRKERNSSCQTMKCFHRADKNSRKKKTEAKRSPTKHPALWAVEGETSANEGWSLSTDTLRAHL